MVKIAIQVPAPRSAVFAVLSDYARYPQWVPGCEKCSIVSAQGQISTIEIVMNSMKRTTMGLRFDVEPDQLLKFELVSSKDVKAYAGSYKLMNSTEGGTLLVTELELDAGPLAPKFMVDRMVKSSIDATGVALQKQVKLIPQTAEAAPVAVKEPRADKKAKRPKTLIRVFRTEAGERIWYAGRIFGPE
jgi:uncharacterized protein YndB with AHSA1/START domain